MPSGHIQQSFRYARGLPAFLRERLTSESCRARVGAALESREDALLATLRRGVFEHERSPYLGLMRHAGLEWADLDQLVRGEGVEGALARLHESGVYVTLEEFKGRRPISRGSYTAHVSAEDFDNPLQTAHFTGSTGGSSGVGRRLLVDLALLAHDAACFQGYTDAWGLAERPFVVWRPVPPDNSGIKKVLIRAKLGAPVERWFSQNALSWRAGHARYAAFTWFTAMTARLSGFRFPLPEHVPFDQAEVVARWVSAQVGAGQPPHVDTIVSSAVRVAMVARELGLSIEGTVFRVGSEPLTAAKAQLVADAGARLAGQYSLSETGPVAMPCAAAEAVDDAHVLNSKVALIAKPQTVPAFAEPVNALYLSTVLPATPKLLLNVETGDCGVLVERACTCALGRWGFGRHVHSIRSWEKLTGEGVTVLGSTLVEIIEEVLPQAIGGTALDYQFVETEEDGMTRVALMVSPRVGPVAEHEVAAVVLGHLESRDAGHRLMAGVWRDGRTLRVVRRDPHVTRAGKVLPLMTEERR